MGSALSGRHADGGPLAEELDSARFELKDAQDELRQALVLLHHCEAFVKQAERRELRAIAGITLVQEKLGYTGIRPEELVRVQGMTVRTSAATVDPLGDAGAVGHFVGTIAEQARTRRVNRKP